MSTPSQTPLKPTPGVPPASAFKTPGPPGACPPPGVPPASAFKTSQQYTAWLQAQLAKQLAAPSPAASAALKALKQQTATNAPTFSLQQVADLLNQKPTSSKATLMAPRVGGQSTAGIWTGYGINRLGGAPTSHECYRAFDISTIKNVLHGSH